MEITLTFQRSWKTAVIDGLERIEGVSIMSRETGAGVEVPYRSVDSSIAVAIVSASGVVLGALVTGLLAIAKQSRGDRIVLRTRDGMRLDVPVDCPKEKVESYLAMLKDASSVKIEL